LLARSPSHQPEVRPLRPEFARHASVKRSSSRHGDKMEILSPRIEAYRNLFTRVTTLTLNEAEEAAAGSIYISVTFP